MSVNNILYRASYLARRKLMGSTTLSLSHLKSLHTGGPYNLAFWLCLVVVKTECISFCLCMHIITYHRSLTTEFTSIVSLIFLLKVQHEIRPMKLGAASLVFRETCLCDKKYTLLLETKKSVWETYTRHEIARNHKNMCGKFSEQMNFTYVIFYFKKKYNTSATDNLKALSHSFHRGKRSNWTKRISKEIFHIEAF